MSWWRLFKAKEPGIPAVLREVVVPEPAKGAARRLDILSDEISRRNAKKVYRIGVLSREITGLAEELIQKFGEAER